MRQDRDSERVSLLTLLPLPGPPGLSWRQTQTWPQHPAKEDRNTAQHCWPDSGDCLASDVRNSSDNQRRIWLQAAPGFVVSKKSSEQARGSKHQQGCGGRVPPACSSFSAQRASWSPPGPAVTRLEVTRVEGTAMVNKRLSGETHMGSTPGIPDGPCLTGQS